MQRKTRYLAVLLAVGVVLPAGASTFTAMTEKELVAASDAVVRGRVVSVESFWNDRHTIILSEAVIEVESLIAGAAPRFVALRTAGGTVDGHTVEASGFPAFHRGDRALLFLARDDEKALGGARAKGSADSYRVAGYQLGHYRIVDDGGAGEIAVPTADLGLRFLRKDGRPAAPPRVRRLEDFEQEIRQIGLELDREAGAAGRSPRR